MLVGADSDKDVLGDGEAETADGEDVGDEEQEENLQFRCC